MYLQLAGVNTYMKSFVWLCFYIHQLDTFNIGVQGLFLGYIYIINALSDKYSRSMREALYFTELYFLCLGKNDPKIKCHDDESNDDNDEKKSSK